MFLQLDKVELIEVDQDDNQAMSLRFAISKEPGKVIVEAENLSKSYGDKHVLSNVLVCYYYRNYDSP